MGYPFGQLSGLCPFSASCAPQPTLKKESLDFVFVQAIAITLCVIDAVLVANPNRSTIGAALKKVNSILVRASRTAHMQICTL